jgi:hypothetical protein
MNKWTASKELLHSKRNSHHTQAKAHRMGENLLPYDPVLPLGINPKKRRQDTYRRDTCTLILISALFTIAKLWK